MKIQAIPCHRLSVSVLTAALALTAAPVLAHGSAQRDKARTAAPVAAEQHAFGQQGDPVQASRTIVVEMNDNMRFTPSAIQARRGETIRLVAKNEGKLLHEMVLGTLDQLKAHGELMRKNPEMEHDEPYMTHVEPGRQAQMVWQFTQPGEFHYGCLAPGHFEAGMIGKITVTN